MLLFITTLLTILIIYLAVYIAVFSYRNVLHLPRSWRNIGMTVFFAYACHHFGIKWTIISLLYLSVCAITFILRALLYPLKTKSANYLTGYPDLEDENDFSRNKCLEHSSVPATVLSVANDEQQKARIKFNTLILCPFVPLCLAIKTSFNRYNFFYTVTFSVRNKIINFFKNIKAA